MFEVASKDETFISSLGGLRIIYKWYASDDHLPMVLIRCSLTPQAAAVEAAPMRNECPLYPSVDIPVAFNAECTFAIKACFVSGFCKWSTKQWAWSGRSNRKVLHH